MITDRTDGNDILVARGNRQSVRVRDWHLRYDRFPRIADIANRAVHDPTVELLYRGQRDLKFIERVFLIGNKANPLYHRGDISFLNYRISEIARVGLVFRDLAQTFLATRLGRDSNSTVEGLQATYDRMSHDERLRLAQVLIDALQYQNLKPEVARWRQYVTLLSASSRDAVALFYATYAIPRTCLVVEYMPPLNRGLFRPVPEFIAEFRDCGLGAAYADRDSESFIPYAMLPHYIIGYSKLRLVDRANRVYETAYFPSPHYDPGAADIGAPPNLTDLQQATIQATRQGLSWVWHGGGQWLSIDTPNGALPLA